MAPTTRGVVNPEITEVNMSNVVARDALVAQYRPLALRMARTSRLPAEKEDLRQAALIGLLVAAEKWDPGRGNFPMCAAYWIGHEMQRAALQTRLVRRCRHYEQTTSVAGGTFFEALASDTPDPERALAEARRQREIERILSELTPIDRAALGFEWGQVARTAATLGTTLSNVTRRRRRVVARVRARLSRVAA